MSRLIRFAVLLAMGFIPGWEAIAQADFNPPSGSRWQMELVQTRTRGTDTTRFRSYRSITFSKSTDGFEAVMTIETAASEGGGPGAMFDRAMAALIGQPIRFRLDDAGTIIAIDDQDAVWQRLVDGIAAMVPPRVRDSAIAPLEAMTPDQRREMLGSMLSSVLGGDIASATPGTRDVALPMRSPVGDQMALPGSQRIRVEGDDVVVDISAEGPISIAPGSIGGIGTGGGVSGTARLSIVRRVSASTGLVISSRETSETILPESAGGGRSTSQTMMTMSPLP